MNIQQLKGFLEQNQVPDELLIFQVKGSGRLVCQQYIQQICLLRHRVPCYLSLDDSAEQSLFDTDDTQQYIYSIAHYSKQPLPSDSIVICTQSDVEACVCEEVQGWQLKNYALGVLQGLSESSVEGLCECCADPYHLYAEIDKLQIFPFVEQETIFKQLQLDGAYEDLTTATIFQLTNNTQKRNIAGVKNAWKQLLCQTLNPLAVTSLLYNNFKLIAAIQLSPRMSAEKLGVNPKKYAAVKSYVGCYNRQQLIEILDLLGQIEYNIKNGSLDSILAVDYLITHILSF